MKALREELARDQGSPVITIAGQRRLNMTAIRLAPDFNALNLTEEEEEEVYRAEQERYDEWAAEVSAAQPIVFTLPCLSHPQPWIRAINFPFYPSSRYRSRCCVPHDAETHPFSYTLGSSRDHENPNRAPHQRRGDPKP